MRVLYITNGMASTLNSSLELSRRLAAAGHEVVYASPADVATTVTAHGYRFERLGGDRAFVEQVGAAVPIWRPLAWWRALRRRREIRGRSIANDEIERLVKAIAPDVLLIDIEMHFAVIATASLGLPTLLPIVWFSIFRRPGLPPMHTTRFPGDSFAQRLTIAMSWWRLRFQTVNGETQDRLRRVLRGDVARPVAYDTFNRDDLRAVAAARGFDFRAATSRRHWLRPYAYTQFPILCFNAQEMELPHPRWPTLHYVGPMVHHRRADTSVDAEAGAAWRQYQEKRKAAAEPKPLVYCSLGSFWAVDRELLERVIEVFSRRSEWELVVGLGGKLEGEALESPPDNVLLLEYAPQLEVLGEAACAITHGGITTINECIELGVPMVVYSTRHVDQNGCAVRIVHHKLGVAGDKDADDSAAIERNLERVLGDPSWKHNVDAMRARFEAYRSPDSALELIERSVAADR